VAYFFGPPCIAELTTLPLIPRLISGAYTKGTGLTFETMAFHKVL